MFFKTPYACTLITRNNVIRKSFKLEIGVDTKSHKKVAFHQLNSALGRPRKTSEALLTSPYLCS